MALHAAANLALDLKNRKLAFHEGHHEFETLQRVGLGQQRLLVGDLGVERGCDHVAQLARIVDFAKVDIGVVAELFVELRVFNELFGHLTHQRGDLAAGDRLGFEQVDLGENVVVFGAQAVQLSSMGAFDHHAHGAVGQLQHLKHLRDHAYVIEVFALGIVAARIELCEQEDILAGLHRRFERGDRFVAPHEERHDHAGKHDDVAQRQERKLLSHMSIHGGHWGAPFSGIWVDHPSLAMPASG